MIRRKRKPASRSFKLAAPAQSCSTLAQLYQLQHLLNRLIRFDALHCSPAGLELHFALGQGFFADPNSNWKTDQLRVLELYARAFIPVVDDHIHPASREVRV